MTLLLLLAGAGPTPVTDEGVHSTGGGQAGPRVLEMPRFEDWQRHRDQEEIALILALLD